MPPSASPTQLSSTAAPRRWRTVWGQLANLPLAQKTAGLAALTGSLSAAIAISAMGQLLQTEQRYGIRIQQESQNALQLATISTYLSDATREVMSIPATHAPFDLLQARQQLLQLQIDLSHELHSITRQSPELELEGEFLQQRAKRLFLLGHAAIDLALAEEQLHVLQLLERNFAPAMGILRQDIGRLQHAAQRQAHTVGQVQVQVRKDAIASIILALIVSIGLVSLLSGWFAIRVISRPITDMTQSMRRLARRDYASPLLSLLRKDELGTMAEALQVFRDSMLHNDALSAQIAQSQAAKLLSEQLLALTSALPVAIFQLHVASDGRADLRFVTPRWEAAVRHALTPHQIPALWEKILASLDSLQTVDCTLPAEPPWAAAGTWFKVMASAKRAPDGGVLLNGGWLDVTQEKMQAMALQQASEQTEKSAQQTRHFLATISHEVRTPLNAMLGMAQLLLHAPSSNAQQLHQLETLHRAGLHLSRLTNDVLDISKLDAQGMTLEHTAFALQQVLDDVLSLCQQETNAKGLLLDLRVQPQLPTWLYGDPHRLTQALLNLAHNAIKFTAQGGIRIRIARCPEQPHLVRFSVVDTGPGVQPQDIAKLFQPFYQIDASVTRRFGGTGLGLSIVRQLAVLMHGDTGVRSRLGRGSCFWFTAVLPPASAAEALTAEPCAAPTLLCGTRMLLVDDHPVNLEVMEGLLRKAGVATHACSDGQAAWEHLQQCPAGHYHALITDLEMPRLNGWELCRRVRTHPTYAVMPVVAMTAHTHPQAQRRCKAAGINGWITKPIEQSALWSALAQVLPAPVDVPAVEPSPVAPPSLAPAGFDPPACIEADFSLAAWMLLGQYLPADHLRAVTQRCIQDVQHRLPQLQHAATLKNLEGLRSQAHVIAGTAATFGLARLGQLASQLAETTELEPAIKLLTAMQNSADTGLAALQAALHRDCAPAL